jgi:hypothetical protein
MTAESLAGVDWDFRGADTKRLTHCFHAYPAMMIPQIAGKLIDAYGAGARVLFDPYCGTGTSLVEAAVRGIDAAGSDLNPLARLIARAKTARIDVQKLGLYLRDMNENLFDARFRGGGLAAPPPALRNIDFWFSRQVQRKLAIVKFLVEEIGDEDVRRFFQVALSETVRECSYTRNGEFKLYRMTAAQMERFQPDVFGVFLDKLARNFAGLKEYARAANNRAQARVFGFNPVIAIPPECVPEGGVDIIVSSPPYGDSRTTVAYGQFSRLASEWLGFENAAGVDRELMGGGKPAGIDCGGGGDLQSAIKRIAGRNSARAGEIAAFYADYRRSIARAAATIRPGGVACYVVGNRKVKGITLPTSEATKFYFLENGFRHKGTFVRGIPNKRMPSKNSPSNVAGETDTTMKNEYIVVMQKIKRRRAA